MCLALISQWHLKVIPLRNTPLWDNSNSLKYYVRSRERGKRNDKGGIGKNMRDDWRNEQYENIGGGRMLPERKKKGEKAD